MTQPRLGRVKRDTTVYEVMKGVRDGLRISKLEKNQLVLLMSIEGSRLRTCFTLLDAEGATHSCYDNASVEEIMACFDWEQLCIN